MYCSSIWIFCLTALTNWSNSSLNLMKFVRSDNIILHFFVSALILDIFSNSFAYLKSFHSFFSRYCNLISSVSQRVLLAIFFIAFFPFTPILVISFPISSHVTSPVANIQFISVIFSFAQSFNSCLFFNSESVDAKVFIRSRFVIVSLASA